MLPAPDSQDICPEVFVHKPIVHQSVGHRNVAHRSVGHWKLVEILGDPEKPAALLSIMWQCSVPMCHRHTAVAHPVRDEAWSHDLVDVATVNAQIDEDRLVAAHLRVLGQTSVVSR